MYKSFIVWVFLLLIWTIFLNNGLYLYSDGSYWPLSIEIAKGNFMNEFKSFVVTNGSSWYDKNLFTGTRIISNGFIYLSILVFWVLWWKIFYLLTALFLLVHSLYLLASRFFIKNKYHALLFWTFFWVSGIYLNNTNQIYLYTIPAIFYSLFLTLNFLKTGQYRYLPLLILAEYMLLGYIRYTMIYFVFLWAVIFILQKEITYWISIKKILLSVLSWLIAFSIPITTLIYLKLSQIPSSSSSFSSFFENYYPQINYSELINIFYAFNLERDFHISFLIWSILWIIILGFNLLYLLNKQKWKNTNLALVCIISLIIYMTVMLFKEWYFSLVKVLPFIRNQPLYLVYFPMFFWSLLLFNILKTRILMFITLMAVWWFSFYWSSFSYFDSNKLENTINFTKEVGFQDWYNHINIPTLYSPTYLLNYWDYKAIWLHNFMSFPTIWIDNARLFFWKTFDYNRSILLNWNINIENLKENANLKLIKSAKFNFEDNIVDFIQRKHQKEIDKLVRNNDIQFEWEDDFYKYYSPVSKNTEDYFIYWKQDWNYSPIKVTLNKNNNDIFLLETDTIWEFELNLLSSYSQNWHIQKINNEANINLADCTNFETTKNTYCVTDFNLNKLLSRENTNITLSKETSSWRNSFILNNDKKGQFFLLYYKSHPIKDLSVYIQNFLD